ncbi:Cj0069 family protein [Alicyclobacillus mengziensis]|uniref:Cj0069 family protein n=1 Tax=Alicyclobacillus mengziensis TaxID=2931921 RepID=A0A9X7Z5X6_9BACL|nr:Cj0069 family protein [Alicyclobacillus mengziensis]QSO45633.1 Cj0069 family protein [Alicyclobacillus mengziensis]
MDRQPRVAILWHGDRETRNNATGENHRLNKVFEEFKKHGVIAEPAVYNDAFVEEVRHQLNEVDGVLVWVNPIQDGMNRTILDDMLRDVASRGVFVSTHPDVILKLGTKEVVFQTREMEWGGDVHLYKTVEELQKHLPARLATGESRVLKQNRGNGGNGVWRVELVEGTHGDDAVVRVLHALRNSTEKQMPISEFMNQYEMYFKGSGQLIDQPFHSPVPDGMVRCYMSHDKVVGFGHQYVTALLRSELGSEPLEPQPRIYHPDTKPEFQTLKAKMETEWIAQLQRVLYIDTNALPVIWDADFLYGPKTETGEDTYVLCEVNVSSVYPFPESALPRLVETALDCIRHHRLT